jgi:hypothetical protein
MATLEEALFSYLTSAPQATAALIGTRLYPLLVPQEQAMPAIAYQRVGTQPKMEHGGMSGWARAVIQFTCQATSYSGVKAITQALRSDLAGYRGTMATGIDVHFCNQVNENDQDELFDAAVSRCDFEFLYKE